MFRSILIELTSRCSMECDFCMHNEMDRPQKHLDYDTFTQIVDEITEHKLTQRVKLFGIGESTLYPRLLEAIKYCADRNLDPALTANGLGVNGDKYKEWADNGLKELDLSLHDLTAESFVYRRGKWKVGYEEFYANIVQFIDFHVREKIPVSLSVGLMFSKKNWLATKIWDMPSRVEDTQNAESLIVPFIEDMRNIATQNGTECELTPDNFAAALKRLKVYNYEPIRIFDNVDLVLVPVNPDMFNTRKKMTGELSKTIKLIKKDTGGCNSIRNPMILSDGSFVPCCFDGLGELKMGRVSEENTLISILDSEQYQTIIEGFRNNQIVNPICQECLGKLVYRNPIARSLHAVREVEISNIAKRKIRPVAKLPGRVAKLLSL